MAEQRHVSIPKPFASGDAGEWFKRFEICARQMHGTKRPRS